MKLINYINKKSNNYMINIFLIIKHFNYNKN